MRRIGFGAAVPAGLLALGLVATATPAQAAGNGEMVTTISGVPSSLPVGGSFEVTFTIRSTSQYRIYCDDLFLSVYNITQGGGGVSVVFQDPGTGGWRAPDRSSNQDFTLNVINSNVVIQPHGSLAVHARVTLNGDAPRGKFRLLTNGVSGYSLLDAAGHGVNGSLDNYNMPQTTFQYGSGGGAPAPATPSTHAPTPVRTSRPPSEAPTPSATPSSETPAAADSAAPTPTATPADPPASAPTPSSSPSAVALETTGSSHSGLALLAGFAALVVGAALGAGVLVRRRRQAERQV